MSNYVKITDFASKDALATGNPLKLIKGTEINDELNAIQTAVATKADLASPAFTGNPTATTQATGNSSTRLATTAFVTTAVTNGLSTLGTIATQNANNVAITGGSITGLTTLAIPSAATAVTQSVGDNTTKVATTAFVNAEIANDITETFTGSNQSISTNGYQKLPGGLIMQWGEITLSNGNLTAFSFPISFTSNCFYVSVVRTDINGSTQINATSYTNSGFSINGSSDLNEYPYTLKFFAIGK